MSGATNLVAAVMCATLACGSGSSAPATNADARPAPVATAPTLAVDAAALDAASGAQDRVLDAAFTAGGDLYVVSLGRIARVDATTGDMIDVDRPHGSPRGPLAVLADGTVVLSAADRAMLVRWNPKTGALEDIRSNDSTVFLAPGQKPGELLAIAGNQPSRIDLATGEITRLRVPDVENDRWWAIAPAGSRLVVATAVRAFILDRDRVLADVPTNMLGHEAPPIWVSPDGETLATKIRPGVRLWGARDGKPLASISLADLPTSLTWLPGGLIAVGDRSGIATLWSFDGAQVGRALRGPGPLGTVVEVVALGDDSLAIVGLDDVQIVRLDEWPN